MLSLRLDLRGFTPVSGIIVVNHMTLLDAILLAAVRPCVFVAGAEVHRWPIVGVVARLGCTLFGVMWPVASTGPRSFELGEKNG